MRHAPRLSQAERTRPSRSVRAVTSVSVVPGRIAATSAPASGLPQIQQAERPLATLPAAASSANRSGSATTSSGRPSARSTGPAGWPGPADLAGLADPMRSAAHRRRSASSHTANTTRARVRRVPLRRAPCEHRVEAFLSQVLIELLVRLHSHRSIAAIRDHVATRCGEANEARGLGAIEPDHRMRTVRADGDEFLDASRVARQRPAFVAAAVADVDADWPPVGTANAVGSSQNSCAEVAAETATEATCESRSEDFHRPLHLLSGSSIRALDRQADHRQAVHRQARAAGPDLPSARADPGRG